MRDEVAAAWRREQQQQAAKARAEELLQAAKDGKALPELVGGTTEAELVEIAPVTRTGTPQTPALGPAAVEALFATPPGKLAEKVVQAPAGAALVMTAEVIPANPDATADEVVRELTQAQRGELLAQYQEALHNRFDVEINEASLNALLKR